MNEQPDGVLGSYAMLRVMTTERASTLRSGPNVTPEVGYLDPSAAVQWLTEVLGMRRGLVVSGPDRAVAHAELWWKDGAVFVSRVEEGPDSVGRSVVCLAAQDEAEVDRIYERALEQEAPIAFPLTDTAFGSHQCALSDPEGNTWTIGTYRPVVPDTK
jgi:uncharacterized glyoxalase superfamily protein PhnB